MTTVLHTLKEYDYEAWKALQNMYGIFLHGECYAFALALHRGLGYRLMGLIGGNGVINHAVVAEPDGGYRDIRGVVSPEEAKKPFSVTSIRQVSERELYQQRPIHDRDIVHARKVAETLWPELPWDTTAAQKVVAFTDELEALCRKHGVWIFGAIPAQQPIIQAMDEESFRGYDLKPNPNGTMFHLERVLERK